VNPIPFRERLSCTVAEACAATGLGRTKAYELIRSHRFVAKKIDNRTLILVKSVIEVIEGTPKPPD
jgi:Helix-turn-helix domain